MLWAITSFFNPAGYKNRLSNYHRFRSRLNVPLVAVELSFTGRFELRDSDAEILIQISGADVMWQKERLLNIALGAQQPSATSWRGSIATSFSRRTIGPSERDSR